MSTPEEKPFKHTMADPQFGKLVPDDFPDERDAIHIATCAVYAATDLLPGEHIGLVSMTENIMGRSEIAPLGIVDPFLTEPVKKGERFWVFLYPGTIRSLRHAWSHPAFDKRLEALNKLVESPSMKRMKHWAAQLPPIGSEEEWDSAQGCYTVTEAGTPITLENVLEKAKLFLEHGEYWSEGATFEDEGIYDEFWNDFEILTGIPVPEDKKYGFLTCSC